MGKEKRTRGSGNGRQSGPGAPGRSAEKRRHRTLSLYQRFALTMIAAGILPMLIVSIVLLSRMRSEFTESLNDNYLSAARYLSYRVDDVLENVDTASRYLYSYDDGTDRNSTADYDTIRQILSGENYDYSERKEETASAMTRFLAALTDSTTDIFAAHFICNSEETGTRSFHYSPYSTYLENEDLFRSEVGWSRLDREDRKLILIPPHSSDYFATKGNRVFTVARNYYDIRGAVGQEKYVGTLYLDVFYNRLSGMLQSMTQNGADAIVMADGNGVCYYAGNVSGPDQSMEDSLIGVNLSETGQVPTSSGAVQVISAGPGTYGCRIYLLVDTVSAFRQISSLQLLAVALLGISIGILILASTLFSRQLTRPIRRMMDSLAQIGQGNFDLSLPVERNDEIGVLSERFNEMSRELKKYINQSYLARMRQTEAELTALRSQIYPHFLYNTLEIIRMTAVENSDEPVAEMLEALSEQIHYLIGPVGDKVPLSRELDIVQKYIYLLNCRIHGKVTLEINAPEAARIEVPRLILQPIAENAYVHGIRPKNGSGIIHIDALRQGDDCVISVMDNGSGMDEAALQGIRELLAGNRPGIKNQDNWQSIGLKNVHDRIRYLYGDSYGVTVQSTPGIGTIVEVRLPFRTISGGEENHADNDSGR